MQAALDLQGVVGGNITSEDDTLAEALAELLPATAGQVTVLRDIAEAASTQSGPALPCPVCLPRSLSALMMAEAAVSEGQQCCWSCRLKPQPQLC